MNLSAVCATPVMTHPGLPHVWAMLVLAGIVLMTLFVLWHPLSGTVSAGAFFLGRLPWIGPFVQRMTRNPWPWVVARIVFVAFFCLVIFAGLWGTPIPERNLATTLTWNIWWALVILSVFFLGTSWCAVCPWDALATWLIRQHWWQRGDPESSLNWKVPRPLRSVWPALGMFVGLTWLELGVGVTVSPYATALLALLIVVLSVVSLALFERKAFCRYFCPIGRTLGFYAQLAPVALRPIHKTTCAQCDSLACYHGTEKVQPCPTFLTMGRFAQNTYCLSCGSCATGCPHGNVGWHLRSMASEARWGARPHWDEAWFLLSLLALTSLHGVTMLPLWEGSILSIARSIGDSGQLLFSFSIGMTVILALPLLVYSLATVWTRHLAGRTASFRHFFSSMVFATLPIAFSYHLAHNLNHVAREGSGFWQVLGNPLGSGTQPLSALERHVRMITPLIPETVLATLQAFLLLWGFWLAVGVLRHRSRDLLSGGVPATGFFLWPMLLFIAGVTLFNTWLLTQDMVMRL